ncbi:MAG TPA: hypothetical protein VJ765_16185 [Chitinophagaceae bacterium]|nr:hypothetical protein [Chitinophagaceae bacterium]
MDVNQIQQQLFQFIKTKLPADASVADEVAKLLNISSDSAYRRMRGEKQITFEELYLLCTNYRISLDQLMNIQTGGIMFQGNIVNPNTFGFDQYLTGMMHTLGYFNSFKNKELYYSCKDLPIFHHFHLREIAAFKWFFWHKTYLQFPGFAKKKFNFSDYPDELFVLDQQVLGLHNQLSTREIWNIESMSIFLRQIEFYRDSQVFESDQDALKLYEALEKTWDHLEKQAALGYKFKYGDPERKPLGEFKMYFNEVLLGDNSILIVTDGVKLAILTHTTFNYVMTRDVTFTENMYNHMLNQIKRSTLISEVSEKERSRFFRIIRDRIARRKETVRG